MERVNLSPLLLGNTAARIKVNSPKGERKLKNRLAKNNCQNYVLPNHLNNKLYT